MRGDPVGDLQLLELERTLRHELSGPDLQLNETNLQAAYRDQGLRVHSLIEFLRYLLDLEGVPDYEEIVARQFSSFIADHPFNANQTRFLRAVQRVFLEKRRIGPADLYAPPLNTFGQDAVERWFSPGQIDELLAFARSLTVTGV